MDLLNEIQELSSQFEAWVFVIGLVLIGMLLGFMFTLKFVFKEGDYMRGQIDAINGKVKYEKRENEDGELVWEKKPKLITADEGPK
jgi:hypothetical protein